NTRSEPRTRRSDQLAKVNPATANLDVPNGVAFLWTSISHLLPVRCGTVWKETRGPLLSLLFRVRRPNVGKRKRARPPLIVPLMLCPRIIATHSKTNARVSLTVL